jgi:ABC-type branched-subunit amino acid transport system ATPase component
MSPALFEAMEISAGYGGADIIHRVSLQIDAGEIVTIIGPNGAGKSTFLKAAFGLLRPSHGMTLLRGIDVTRLRPPKMVAAGVSFVPQLDNVFPSLSIRENLEMGGYLAGRHAAARADEVLAMFPELGRRPTEHAGRLSGGQRQALALGRALMLNPVLLMLDEPTAALSPLVRNDVFERLKAIRERGVAILIVEQNAREALAISDRGVVLVAGSVALEQPGVEMLANPSVGRLFLGLDDPEAVPAAIPTSNGGG